MTRDRAVIALGANLGDRVRTIKAAVSQLDALDSVTLTQLSPLYSTPAIKISGVDYNAPEYLNAVAIVHTSLSATALLQALHAIEHDLGRVRDERWGDRTIDLDLIDFSGQKISVPGGITIPHPRAWERAFVLQPWLDIEPNAVLPGYGSVSTLRAAAQDEVTPLRSDIRQGAQ